MYTCGQVLPTLGIALPDPATLESGVLTETPLSGCHCVRLLPLLPQPSLPSLTHLLAALLPSELAEVPRGTVSSAMRQCQAPTPLEKAVRGVEPLLRGLCLACQERDTVHGLVAGEECGSLYSPIIRLIVKIRIWTCMEEVYTSRSISVNCFATRGQHYSFMQSHYQQLLSFFLAISFSDKYFGACFHVLIVSCATQCGHGQMHM